MIEDVYLGTVSTSCIGQNMGAGGSGSGSSASLIVFVPNASISAQISSSLVDLSYWGYDFPASGEVQIAPWSVEWQTSAYIIRYVQPPAASTFLEPPPTIVENIPNCIVIQFSVGVGVFPFGNSPTGYVNAFASALATATIFIES